MNTSLSQTIKNLQLPLRFEHKLCKDIDYILSCDIPSLESIILFGSCARGQMKLTSDLDLLIVTASSLERSLKGDISSILEESFEGVKTDIIFYTREQYDNSIRLFTAQVKKEGILLYSTS